MAPRNPADIPTRPERAHEMPTTAVEVPFVLPPMELMAGDVAGMIRRARESAAAETPEEWLARVRVG